MLHASIKNYLNLNFFFKISKSAILWTKKKNLKKIRSIFNENIDQFCVLKKKISSVFNENIEKFFVLKKSKLKNLDKFCVFFFKKKKTNLYLMKIQISF